MNDHDDELFRLQQTLYDSRNPTRRWLHRTRRDWIVGAIERWGSGSRRALEVGPGAGIYLPTLAAVAKEVVASDVERAYLDRLVPAAAACGADLVWDDITDSHFTDAEFDLVLCSEVIEHIPDGPAALREIRRILDPEGVLVLSTPQRYSLLEVASKVAFLPGFIQLAAPGVPRARDGDGTHQPHDPPRAARRAGRRRVRPRRGVRRRSLSARPRRDARRPGRADRGRR